MKLLKLILIGAICYGGYCWYRNGGSIDDIDSMISSNTVTAEVASTFAKNKDRAIALGKNIYQKGIEHINSNQKLKSAVDTVQKHSKKALKIGKNVLTDIANKAGIDLNLEPKKPATPKATVASASIDDGSRTEGVQLDFEQFSIADASSLRQAFISSGIKYRGTPYILGCTNPEVGLDCSSFTQLAAKSGTGVKLPRTANQQYYATETVSESQREPGDLVFFKSFPFGKVTHVGIYLGRYPGEGPLHGRELFINCQSKGRETGVVVGALDSSYWRRTYFASGRFLPSTSVDE